MMDSLISMLVRSRHCRPNTFEVITLPQRDNSVEAARAGQSGSAAWRRPGKDCDARELSGLQMPMR
jgi:hypothetical protein